jgi:flagellar protein FliO/FliZ
MTTLSKICPSKVRALLCLLSMPGLAFAQQTNQSSFAAELWRTGVVLMLVIGMLLASLWLVKRFKAIPSATRDGKILQSIAVGANERVVLLEVQHRQYLVGVTTHQISLLDQWNLTVQNDAELQTSVANINATRPEDIQT